MTKILVVDDSALMRNQLTTLFTQNGYQVEYARHGQECLDKLPIFKPDLITLDVNMPVMDGISCLREIMRSKPTPVLMVSSLTTEGAKASIEAMELGAIDFIPKPSGAISLLNQESVERLLAKVKNAAGAQLKTKLDFKTKFAKHQNREIVKQQATSNARLSNSKGYKAVLIGVSTGGPATLQEIISALPEKFPVPIIIAQHMPERFTAVFAQRLNQKVKLPVTEVKDTVELLAGNVYLAKGDADIVLSHNGQSLLAKSINKVAHEIWHPSINHLVRSAIDAVMPDKLLCVQLTGMGNDGAEAMHQAFTKGAYTIAESEETATVFGMPKELIARNGASKVLANFKIAQELCERVK